ncbi:MAG: (Fe-S)-binding protein [Gammaproteobacteria bacterium]|nr:(Fe-S)-binding protein [Gammaproteobacteria bacterium]
MSSAKRVGLFVTCLVDLYRPNVGFAAVKLLENAGYQVEVPGAQTCCGQPAFNSGDYDSTREIAMQVIAAFEDFDYVVGASGSCMGTIKTYYADLFKDEPDWQKRAAQLTDKAFELTSFLTDIAGIDSVDAGFEANITYHDSCTGLRELGVKQQPRQLLDSVKGLSLTEMANSETCCGFGGTFCIKFPQISTRLASDKVDNIEASKAEVLLGGDMGCLLNIGGRLKRLDKSVKVYHVAEVLAGMTDLPAIGEAED